MDNRSAIFVHSDIFFDGVDVYIMHEARPVVGLTLGEHVSGTTTPRTMSLGRKEAQQLANQLWDAGFRPSQGKQSEGVTAAQAGHLADMRQIAFSKLNIDKPETPRENR